MTLASTPTLATLDAVWDARDANGGRFDRFVSVSDSGAFYRVLGKVDGDPDSVFAQSPRTDLIVMVTRVGSVNVRGKGEQVRVRVMFATDTGDAAGTLAFEPRNGIGGIAPRALFG